MKRAVVYGLVYVALSMGVEIVLLVVFRLRVPQDNRIIAPIILLAPPVAAAWWARRPDIAGAAALAALTSVLTVATTVVVTRATGRSVGLLEPLLSRPAAAVIAMAVLSLRARHADLPRGDSRL